MIILDSQILAHKNNTESCESETLEDECRTQHDNDTPSDNEDEDLIMIEESIPVVILNDTSLIGEFENAEDSVVDKPLKVEQFSQDSTKENVGTSASPGSSKFESLDREFLPELSSPIQESARSNASSTPGISRLQSLNVQQSPILTRSRFVAKGKKIIKGSTKEIKDKNNDSSSSDELMCS